ncbi:hypothetical protein CXF68_03705 [Tenacibaculum sp. Bg11-29]|uniref:hypothetical protein n=1 Tax=Tenacibaculum sp. Bg11-29 TaxID=2058306 RepID=UPI000C32560D|nr:hypothetical protein [Tenacibaculum sp. Bg11-29]PKH49857.1 hypothetical protein CXF68_03705 [Tenacibaculum sp. Bg11-29]
MTNHSLFNFQGIETDLEAAITSSIFDFKDSMGDAKLWAETDLKQRVEQSMRGYSQSFITKDKNGCCGNIDPPGSGFKVTFGLQIQLAYKVRFKANLNIGYGQRYGNFAANTSFHVSAYNSGLGVDVDKSNMVVDVTAAANVIVGGGHGTPLQSYSLNYNSPIPMLNNFENSFRYGQLFTWNSALHDNQFSLDKLQREGMIGFRLGNVNVSSNNDTKRAYFGDKGDRGWTGGISIVTPLIEVGFQDFSGDYQQKAIEERKKEEIDNEIKTIKRNPNLEKEIKKEKIKKLEEDLKKLTYDKYHNQTTYQKNLNKASTYIRFNQQNGYNATIDVIGAAWLQNAIHRTIKDFRFEYEHNNIEGWGGIKF